MATVRIVALLSSAIYLVNAAPSLAQTNSEQESSDKYGDAIIVTAKKRSESLQDSTTAIDVTTSQDLVRSGKATLDDVLRDQPNAQVSSAGGGNIFIRGIGSTADTVDGREQAVVVNIDGVSQASGRILNAGLFDMERIEVVAGPQGTLYGRNATGGVVNLVSVTPGDSFAARGNLQIGNYNAYRFEGGVTIPVSQAFAVRVSGLYDKHDGYGTDGINAADNWGARIKPRLSIGDNFELLGTFEYRHEGGTPSQAYPLTALEYSDPWDHGYTGYAGIRDNRYYNASLKLRYIADFATFTLVPAYNKTHFYQQIPNPIPTEFDIPQFVTTPTSGINKQKTLEFQVASPDSSSVTWIAGLYYMDVNNDKTVEAARMGINPACEGTTICDPIIEVAAGEPAYSPAKSYAAYAQVTYPLTARLKATAGLRYTRDERGGYYTDAAGEDASYSLTFDNLSWTAGISYELRPGSLFYANVATGYKAGGANIPDQTYAASTAITKYDPEVLTSYTLGTKNTFVDGAITINAELYHYDYKNFQFSAVSAVQSTLGEQLGTDCTNAVVGPVADPTSECVSYSYIGNAPGSKATGGEFTVIAHPSSADMISLKLSVEKTKFGEFTYSVPGEGDQSYKGDPFLNAPRFAAVGSYRHTFTFKGGAELDVGATVTASAKYNTSFDYRAYSQFIQPAYQKVDLSAGFTPASGVWSLRGYVRNLTKQAVVQAGSPLAVFLNDPRVFGASLAFDF